MGVEGLEKIRDKYLKQLDDEYQKAATVELENYARELVRKRIESLEPLRKRIIELFRS